MESATDSYHIAGFVIFLGVSVGVGSSAGTNFVYFNLGLLKE